MCSSAFGSWQKRQRTKDQAASRTIPLGVLEKGLLTETVCTVHLRFTPRLASVQHGRQSTRFIIRDAQAVVALYLNPAFGVGAPEGLEIGLPGIRALVPL